MKNTLLILGALLLFSLPLSAQKNLSFSAEGIVGFGFGKGPVAFETTQFVAEYHLGEAFVLGAGAGLRCAIPTYTYHVTNGKAKREAPYMEFVIPLFLRLGYYASRWNAVVDGGYAVGLFSVSGLNSGDPAMFSWHSLYKGFFVDPHVAISFGKHNVGLGVLFQQTLTRTSTSTSTDTTLSTHVEEKTVFTPALTLRYAFRF